MSAMITLTPGETFRHLVTMWTEGRDSPRLDLTGCGFEIWNLEPAPWGIEVLPVDLPNGQVQLFISHEATRHAEGGHAYPFQFRITFPAGSGGDVLYLAPITIIAGPTWAGFEPEAGGDEGPLLETTDAG